MAKKKPMLQLMQLDILTKFSELLKIRVVHDYFGGESCPDIEIIPDNKTKITLKQLQLVAKQEGSNLSMGYAQQASIGSSIERLERPEKLTFWIRSNDSSFLSYTDLPFEFGDFIYHFTNKDTDKIDDEHRNLSADEFVREGDRLPVAGAFLDYRLEDPMDDVEVEVVNELGESVFDRQYKGSTNVCSVRLLDEPPGKYTLLLDGMEEYSYYLLGDSVKNLLGVIDIYIDKNDYGVYSFFDAAGQIFKQEYKIHFTSRAVHWRYIFIETNPNNPQHSGHKIVDNSRNGNDYFFTEAVEITLENGTKAVMIESEDPIPFKLAQDERFKLRTLRSKGQLEWMTDLPCASAKSIIKVNNNGKNYMFSELIVYL